MVTRIDVAQAIQRAFSNGIPNGWLLGWGDSRYFEDLNSAIHPLRLENLTSFDYSFCNHFELRIKDDDKHYCVLTIRISFVCDIYHLYWAEWTLKDKYRGVIHAPTSNDAVAVESAIRSVLDRHGFFEIPNAWLEEIVPNIKLELSEDRRVTIDKCLFADYDR